MKSTRKMLNYWINNLCKITEYMKYRKYKLIKQIFIQQWISLVHWRFIGIRENGAFPWENAGNFGLASRFTPKILNVGSESVLFVLLSRDPLDRDALSIALSLNVSRNLFFLFSNHRNKKLQGQSMQSVFCNNSYLPYFF